MMKIIQKLMLLTICLFIYISVYGQSDQSILWRNNAGTIVYLGVDNPIYLDRQELPDLSKLEVKLDTTVFDFQLDAKNYRLIIHPKVFNGPWNTISLIYDGKEMEDRLAISRIPSPIASINSVKTAIVTTGQLLASTGLISTHEMFSLDVKCEIKGFSTTIFSTDATRVSINNRGFEFQPETQTYLTNVNAGDFIIFENIQCMCPGDNAARKLASIIYQVK